MTRQIFIIITTITLQICLIILAYLMGWNGFELFIKIAAPSFLLLMGLLSINDNICYWLSQPLFKRKNIDDDLNFL
jgi:hypothetical protein